MFFLFLVSVCIFLVSFVSGRKHLLATLLSLEGVTLILFGLMSWMAVIWSGLICFILLFLTFVACEGALGLSLLVVIVRWWGEDRVLSLNLLRS
nr:NADH dehydrogenase subunit 4L [Chydorus sphaericus]